MGKHKNGRKGDKCPHCKVIVFSSFSNHKERCEIFAPLDEFVTYWNECRVTSKVAKKYKVDASRVSRFLMFLRRKTDLPLPLDRYAESRGRQMKVYTNKQGEMVMDRRPRCRRCAMLSKTPLCEICKREDKGEAFWQNRRAHKLAVFGDE